MTKEKDNRIIEKLKENYDSIADTFSMTRNYLWPEMKGLKGLVKKGKVLDLGCGNGRLFELFKDNPDIHYLGIDISPKMVAIAKKRYPTGNFIEGDIAKLKLNKGHYDAIFMIASYHHIPSRKLRLDILKNLKKSLKDDGTLVITVWNLWNQKARKRVLSSWKRKLLRKEPGGIFDIYYTFNDHGNIVYRYYRMFTSWGIKREFRKAGFRVVKQEKWGKNRNLAFYLKKKR